MAEKNNHRAARRGETASHAALYGWEGDNRLVMIAFTVSLILHGSLFAMLIYAQTHIPKQRPAPIVMNVSLVSLPPSAGSGKAPSAPSHAVKANTPQKQATVKQKPTPKVSDAPKKIQKKVSLKKKTYQSEKVKKNTLQKLEKEIETGTSGQIAKAIDEIKAKVDSEKDREPIREAPAQAPGSGHPGGEGEAGGGKLAEIIDIYRMEIAYKVQQNWAFPEQLAGGRSDLQTLLVFKVMPNGEIKDLFFTDRSGNSHFDESAFRAVMKSNPVSPHPKSISVPYVQMGLRFTPEGIQ